MVVEEVHEEFHEKGLMALVVGKNVGGQGCGVKWEENCLFVYENLEFLRIKYYNLHSQTNELYFIVLFKTPTLLAHSFLYQKT